MGEVIGEGWGGSGRGGGVWRVRVEGWKGSEGSRSGERDRGEEIEGKQKVVLVEDGVEVRRPRNLKLASRMSLGGSGGLSIDMCAMSLDKVFHFNSRFLS